jgi:hypothetical protein
MSLLTARREFDIYLKNLENGAEERANLIKGPFWKHLRREKIQKVIDSLSLDADYVVLMIRFNEPYKRRIRRLLPDSTRDGLYIVVHHGLGSEAFQRKLAARLGYAVLSLEQTLSLMYLP